MLLILAYGWTTSANRSLSHSKRDRSTITKPIKAIAQSTHCDRAIFKSLGYRCDRLFRTLRSPNIHSVYAKFEKTPLTEQSFIHYRYIAQATVESTEATPKN